MKGYSTLPKSPELEPHHQMQFSVVAECVNNCIKSPIYKSNKFYFLNLSEKFIEKQKLQNLLEEKIISKYKYFPIFTLQEKKVNAFNVVVSIL